MTKSRRTIYLLAGLTLIFGLAALARCLTQGRYRERHYCPYCLLQRWEEGSRLLGRRFGRHTNYFYSHRPQLQLRQEACAHQWECIGYSERTVWHTQAEVGSRITYGIDYLGPYEKGGLAAAQRHHEHNHLPDPGWYWFVQQVSGNDLGVWLDEVTGKLWVPAEVEEELAAWRAAYPAAFAE